MVRMGPKFPALAPVAMSLGVGRGGLPPPFVGRRAADEFIESVAN